MGRCSILVNHILASSFCSSGNKNFLSTALYRLPFTLCVTIVVFKKVRLINSYDSNAALNEHDIMVFDEAVVDSVIPKTYSFLIKRFQ